MGTALRNGDGSWSFGLNGLVTFTLAPNRARVLLGFRDILVVQLTGLLQGLAFGMLLLISAAAIAAYYLLPNASSALFSIPHVKHTGRWIDLNTAQTALYTRQMTATTWAQVLTAALIWVALPLGLGFVRVLHSEIRSS